MHQYRHSMNNESGDLYNGRIIRGKHSVVLMSYRFDREEFSGGPIEFKFLPSS